MNDMEYFEWNLLTTGSTELSLQFLNTSQTMIMVFRACHS